MLILHTGHAYYPEVCGISEVVTQLSKRIASRQHEVHGASLKCARTPAEYTTDGVAVHRFDLLPRRSLEYGEEARAYVDFAKSRPWDVVVMHYFISATTLALLPFLHDIPGKKINLRNNLKGRGMLLKRQAQESLIAGRWFDAARAAFIHFSKASLCALFASLGLMAILMKHRAGIPLSDIEIQEWSMVRRRVVELKQCECSMW